ncbi:MAG: disulfide bond formation protein B [Gammaproteobacteria bacterium]|nr:disulfide bond formation protein B [Gammaproteobacteria bacterium]
MQILKQISQGKLYWVLLLILGISMESTALYYQYVLDEWPCVLCIHIRIWVSGFTLLALLALLVKHSGWLTRCFHLVNSLLLVGFVERSWMTLAVERGWIFSDCNMQSGLPAWFALDKWLPAIFEVKTSCGYTPYILFQISMAEVLIVFSAGLLLCSLLLLLVHLLPD